MLLFCEHLVIGVFMSLARARDALSKKKTSFEVLPFLTRWDRTCGFSSIVSDWKYSMALSFFSY